MLQSFGRLATNGGTVALGAATVRLSNSSGAATSSHVGNAALAIAADEIDLASGGKTLAGFSTVALTARQVMTLQGSGSLDVGSAALTLTAPQLLVGTGPCRQ